MTIDACSPHPPPEPAPFRPPHPLLLPPIQSITGEVVQGSNITVTVSLFNAGSVGAVEVNVRDEWPDESFDVVEGKYERVFDSIAPGANESFSFIVSPSVDGEYEPARAVAEYKYLAEGDIKGDLTETEVI